MENTLLIIGNGFDLACGLKSKFSDFYNACLVDKTNHAFGIFRPLSSGFWQGLLFKHGQQNGHRVDYNWCDIEGIVEDTLRKLFIDSPTEAIKSHIGDYLADYVKSNNNTAKKIMYRELLSELKNLESQFCSYLNRQLIASPEIQNPTQEKNDDYYIKAANLLNELLRFTFIDFKNYDDFDKLPTESYANLKNASVLSFNYTNPMDFIHIGLNYTNVHGRLCKNACTSCSTSKIIFGIDDTIVSSDKYDTFDDLRIFSKTYRSLQPTGEKTKILPPKDKPVAIKFFGHSLSQADYSYFQSIFDYYDIYDKTDVSLEFCYSKGRLNSDKLDAVYKLINTYGTTLNNKDKGKNLIHKLLLENRIKIKELYTDHEAKKGEY